MSAGTVFVELDLDFSRYTRSQQALLKSATSTSLSIEQNFKNLGIKSSAEMDLMRQKIINSFEMIKNSSKATANDIIRAEQAKTTQLKALNDQQFGHQTTLLNKLKTHWLGYAATVTATMLVARQGWNMLKAGADYEEQAGILDNLGKKYKMTADTIVAEMARASDGMISNANLMRIALGGVAKGLDPQQLIKLADAARILGDTVGQDATTALDNLTQALETGRVRGLLNYSGSTIDLGDAFGGLESKLTAAERAQAMYALIMIHATKLQKEQTTAVNDTADKIELAVAQWENFKTGAARALAATAGYIVGLMEKLSNLIAFIRTMGKYPLGGQASGEPSAAAGKNPLAEYQGQITALQEVVKNRKDNADAINKTKTETESLTKSWREMEIVLKGEISKAGAFDRYEEQLQSINTYVEKLIERFKALPPVARAAAMATIEAYKTAKTDEVMTKEAQERLDNEINFYSQIEANGQRVHDLKMRWIDEEQKRLARYYKDEAAAAKWARNEKIKLDAEVAANNLQNIQAGLGAFADTFDTLGQLYAEDSEERKKMHEISMAFVVAEKAALAAQAVYAAVVAIATQGSGDPYTAFVRIAAMAAAMASLLATAGIAFNGSPSAAGASAQARSTVLGAEPGTGSQSIANSLEYLEKIYDVEYTKLTKIYNELKSLNNNITGLVTSIVRTGGISTEGMNLNLDYIKGTSRKLWEGQLGLDMSGKGATAQNLVADFLTAGLMKTPLLQGITSFLGGLGETIFGGGTKFKLIGQGIALGDIVIGNIMAGVAVNAQQYAYVQKTKTGGWFGSDKKSYYYTYAALDSSVKDMLTLVFKNIGETLMVLAQELGRNTNAVLNYVFEEAKINLQGMTTEEMNKALQEYISTVSDTAVEDLFGTMLKGYQKLNEGLMETAVRLITDKAVIMEYLRMTNQSFSGTIPQAIRFSETLIEIAGSLEKLTDAMQTYYDAFFNDAEKQAMLKRQLTETMGMYGMGLPGTRGEYRALVESLNLTTEAGQAAYVALMQMAKGADEYYSYLERAAENARANIRPENYATYYEYQKALAGIPKFAEGGYHAGGYRIVGEYGAELEFTPPSRIINSSQTRSLLSKEEIVSELRMLRADIGSQNYAIAKNTSDFNKILKRWDWDGMPETRSTE